MRKRLFIAIKITGEMATKCIKLKNKLTGLPIKFIGKANLHVTLIPPWIEKNPADAIKKLRKLLQQTAPFTLHTEKFEYRHNKNLPRVAWVKCHPSNELSALQKRLTQSFKGENPRKFIPHITIARFPAKINHEFEIPNIEKNIDCTMTVKSIHLYESPVGTGSGYKTVGVVTFNY